MMDASNEQLQLAANYINYTDCNIFLTGKAGTGKTTFLRDLPNISHKRMVVVAPTGVAAINAKGVTINSFFQIGFGIQLPNFYINNKGEKPTIDFSKYRKERKAIIKSLDLLVIDEISMVRADVLDSIDLVLRQFRRRNLPFGGVQLLMIGDMSQLEPIAKDEEWNILKEHYKTKFFFSSLALQQTGFVSIELQKIYRQVDQKFINILNKVRNNQLDTESLNHLNQRYKPNFEPPKGDNYIILTTHNAYASNYNDQKIKSLKGDSHVFTAKTSGEFPESSYPTQAELELKEGSQVMFIKNDSSPDKLYFNGKIGEVTKINNETILVKCKDDHFPIEVKREKWDNIRYSLNADTKDITEDLIGTFTQVPLKLAWAITIHKSQGLTFEKAIIDAGQSFSFGQVYVALSRCKTLDGMVLSAPITSNNIMSSPIITDFSNYVEQNQPMDEQLFANRIYYQEKLLLELFNFNSIKHLVTKTTNAILTHASAIPKHYADKFLQIETDIATQVVDVAEKFTKQIGALRANDRVVEDNTELQERIRKSVPYFTQRIQEIITSPLSKFTLDIDNKAIKEQVDNDLKALYLESQIKEICLKSIKDGFHTHNYLKARATASIDEKLEKESTKTLKIVKSSNTEIPDSFVPPNPKLYYSLRRFAKDTAKDLMVEPHMVLPFKTIVEICTKLPKNTKELEKVKGIGKSKIDKFGNEILQTINDYISENNITIDAPEVGTKEVEIEGEDKPKKMKISESKMESFRLFNEGASLLDIAKERGYTQGTILNHLLHFVQIGELDATKLIDQEKLNKIILTLIDHPDKSLTELREITNQIYSFDELRIGKFLLQKEEI